MTLPQPFAAGSLKKEKKNIEKYLWVWGLSVFACRFLSSLHQLNFNFEATYLHLIQFSEFNLLLITTSCTQTAQV